MAYFPTYVSHLTILLQSQKLAVWIAYSLNYEISNSSCFQNLQYHSSMLSLHGFHFELKATREGDGRHLFYLQVCQV